MINSCICKAFGPETSAPQDKKIELTLFEATRIEALLDLIGTAVNGTKGLARTLEFISVGKECEICEHTEELIHGESFRGEVVSALEVLAYASGEYADKLSRLMGDIVDRNAHSQGIEKNPTC